MLSSLYRATEGSYASLAAAAAAAGRLAALLQESRR